SPISTAGWIKNSSAWKKWNPFTKSSHDEMESSRIRSGSRSTKCRQLLNLALMLPSCFLSWQAWHGLRIDFIT
ncbi:MAG: hypothetical protein KDA84_20965, partial [Planctomycetaceae bacterium]|nr:hypothetical protein [Planctomycetaceae bacterium]